MGGGGGGGKRKGKKKTHCRDLGKLSDHGFSPCAPPISHGKRGEMAGNKTRPGWRGGGCLRTDRGRHTVDEGNGQCVHILMYRHDLRR